MRLITVLILLCTTTIARTQITHDTIDVFFEFDRAVLIPEERTIITDLLKDVKRNEWKVKLFGHCDSLGSHHYNDALSLRRIQTVKQLLVGLGFSKSGITETRGYGKRLPADDNNTEDGRAYNRRVEIILERKTKTTAVNPPQTIALKKRIADSTVTVGSNIILHNIHFEGGRHYFLPQSDRPLKELLDAMQSFPKLIISIEGHICCQPGDIDGLDLGTGLYNLSEARAKAVMDFLTANGIDRSRLSYKGFGHSRPIHPYPENNDTERMENRRVEIRIIQK